jgi:hypothetical protein
MPSPLRSPKTLAQWFELDYFRRRRLFRGLWRPMTGIALLVSCLAVGWTLFPGNRAVYQAGPVATSHAPFGQDCGKCHTEAFPTWARLWRGDDAIRSVPDAACEQCHKGPPHHECVRQGSCAGCHHEHRGHSALARVTDNHCTSCHADLKCDDGSKPDYKSVTGFGPGRHPEFHLWEQEKPIDPGTLRFNHKVHLDGVLGIDAKQLEAQREKLRQAGVAPCDAELPKKTVRLECQSCHEMDAAGRYVRPIDFDRHCKECHPLSVQLMGDWEGSLRKSACEFSEKLAPHPAAGEGVETVRAALRERLTRFILHPKNKSFLAGPPEPAVPERPLPGWIRSEPVPPREYAWVNRQLERIERVLFDGAGGCRHCHLEKTIPDKPRGGLPEYESPGLWDEGKPWFKHSVFRHDSHKVLKCTECHDARESTTAKDVLLPRIGKCLECHHDGGARADCVECHVYHDPRLKRQYQGSQTIEQFLGR